MTHSPVETELQAMAHTYSHAGWKIFPLWPISGGVCTCSKGAECSSPGKHPLYPPAHSNRNDPLHGKCKYGACGRLGHGLYDATDDPAVNAERWTRHPDAGIGLPAQGNGLAIIDVDVRHDGDDSFRRLNAYCLEHDVDLTATVAQLTGDYGTRGVHYLFTAPDGGITGKGKAFGADMPGLDTRGRGTYIVVAPTMHVTGVRYEWLDWLADIAQWPGILNPIINPAKVPPAPRATAPMGRGMGYGAQALASEIAKVASTAVGGRNHALNAAAFSLGQLTAGGELDLDTVRGELETVGASIGLTGAEIQATIRSGLAAGGLTPRVRPLVGGAV